MRRTMQALLGVAILAAGVARADGFERGTLVSAAWEAGVPIASLRQYVSAPSYSGVQVEVRWGLAPRLSIGLNGGWNWFAQNFSQLSVSIPNGTISGPVYNRVQFFTLRATGHWYLSRGWLQPYLGAGVGGTWYGTYRQVSDLVSSSSGFAFAADPQIGMLVTVAPGLALLLQVRYQFTLARFANVKNAQWFGAELGIALF